MDEEGGFSLGGFLFGNIDESGALDNDDFDKVFLKEPVPQIKWFELGASRGPWIIC